jgi:uncharacterized protein
MGTQERIAELEAQLKKTKYNKATEHHFGVVKAQIAKLREKLEKSSKKGKGEGFAVKKSGNASVVLLGFPSVGKSTLLNALTKSKSKVGAYAFTTLDVVPGVMHYKQAKIQILDVPGIISGAASGKGRGREILSVVRNADLVLVDALYPKHYPAILKELHDINVRVNKEKPIVKISKKPKGGLRASSTVRLTQVTKKTIKAVLQELKIVNADVVIRSNISIDDLIDAVEGNRVYLPSLTVVTKVDLVGKTKKAQLRKEIQPDLMISAEKKENIDELRELIFQKLKFIRIYLKEINKKPDLEEPMIMQKGATLQDLCEKLHRDFVNKFKYAKFWGPSAKFDGQQIKKLKKKLRDEDVVEIHLS